MQKMVSSTSATANRERETCIVQKDGSKGSIRTVQGEGTNTLTDYQSHSQTLSETSVHCTEGLGMRLADYTIAVCNAHTIEGAFVLDTLALSPGTV